MDAARTRDNHAVQRATATRLLAVLATSACLMTACTPGRQAASPSSSTLPPSPGSPAATSTGTGSPAEGRPTSTGSIPSRSRTTVAPPPTEGVPTTTATPQPVPPGTAAGCPRTTGVVTRLAPGTGKTVALTFDDGAGPAMLAIADILRSKGVTATFFDTGGHDSANPGLVRRVASLGFAIEDHTWDHDYPRQTTFGWTVAYLRDQMARTRAVQRRLTGHPVCFFRPPGGYMTNVVAAASAEGLSTVLWSVDTRDWAQPDHEDPAYVATIVANATTLTVADRQHPIILMHAAKASHEPESQVSSYRGNTIAALPRIIDWYTAHGYHFVDLLGQSA